MDENCAAERERLFPSAGKRQFLVSMLAGGCWSVQLCLVLRLKPQHQRRGAIRGLHIGANGASRRFVRNGLANYPFAVPAMMPLTFSGLKN